LAEYETLLYDETDGVAWVTLNRPEALNSFNAQMQRELRSVWTGMRTNEDVRVAVLTGAGEKAFCTGIDRVETMGSDKPKDGSAKVVGSRGSSPFMFDDPGLNICPKQCDLWKPVIAAVNGMACGGAFYMLGEVEFIIAAEHATFFDPHVTYGMTAAFEPIHLMQKMPFGEIMRLSLLGNHERLSAQRAHQVGLVTEVVPADELHDAADRVARIIAAQPALAIQGTVRAIWAGLELSRREALDQAYLFIGLGTNQESISEGQRAFESGQRPKWVVR
jgi:enoyl-CoA hydratase/carnithine racemase